MSDFNNQKYKWRIDRKNQKLFVYELTDEADEEVLCSKDLPDSEKCYRTILFDNALLFLNYKDSNCRHSSRRLKR